MNKKTDGGHQIDEADLRELQEEEPREMPDGVESQTGTCRFCGQAGIVHTLTGWSQDQVDEAVVNIMLATVDAIEAKAMKGISIDVGQGVKAKVSKMAKESIKVERSETSKKIYEE